MGRAMKDSGVEWIGEIPEDWRLMRLCYVTKNIFLGRTPVYSEQDNENYIVGQKNNQSYGIDFGGIKYGEEEFYLSRGEEEFLKKGDVILNTLGGGSVGRIGYWNVDDNNRYLTDGHLMVIRPNEKCNNRYLYYDMVSQQKKLEDDSVGSTNQSFLTVTQVYKNLIAFPPLSEQTRIANYLDTQCAHIDTVFEKTKASIEEYKKLKQAVITHAVTKGVRGERKMKDSGIEWIGEIPEEWEVRRIKTLFTLRDEKNYLPLEKVNLISLYTDLGVVQHSDLEKTSGNKASNADGYKLVKKNDIVVNIILCWMGAIGRSEYDGVTSPAYDIYIPSERLVDSRFYHHYFRTTGFSGDCFKRGRGIMLMRWRTYSDQFRDIPVVYPSLKEQVEIIEYLDNKIPEIDNLIAKKEGFLTELESYKKSLIYEYVTGKKEVPQS